MPRPKTQRWNAWRSWRRVCHTYGEWSNVHPYFKATYTVCAAKYDIQHVHALDHINITGNRLHDSTVWCRKKSAQALHLHITVCIYISVDREWCCFTRFHKGLIYLFHLYILTFINSKYWDAKTKLYIDVCLSLKDKETFTSRLFDTVQSTNTWNLCETAKVYECATAINNK